MLNFFKKKPQENQKILPASPVESNEGYLKPAVRVVESRDWYKKQYRFVLKLVFALVGCCTVLTILVAILLFSKAEPRYFATTQDLRIQELIPLKRPTMNQGGLLTWTTQTISDTFSLDFLHWKKDLTKVKPHYFSKAYKSLVKEMDSSGILALVSEKHCNIRATIPDAPVITAEGMYKGALSWRLEFPMLLSYESGRGIETTSNLLVEVLVQRVSTIEYPKGIKVRQIIFHNAKS